MTQEFLPNFPFKYKDTDPLKHVRIHETYMGGKERLLDNKIPPIKEWLQK